MSFAKYLENRSHSIVVLGTLNPPIFQPYWLAHKNLINEEEASQTEVKIIHNELLSYEIGKTAWASIEVRRDRFTITCSQEPYFPIVKDLVVGIFHFLRETPVTAVGINFHYKLGLRDESNFYNFGNKLCPLSNWDFLKKGRIQSIEVLDLEGTDQDGNHYRIKIDSDEKLTFGVNILLNNHIQLVDQKKESTIVSKVIAENWEQSKTTAESYMESIWNKISI